MSRLDFIHRGSNYYTTRDIFKDFALAVAAKAHFGLSPLVLERVVVSRKSSRARIVDLNSPERSVGSPEGGNDSPHPAPLSDASEEDGENEAVDSHIGICVV